MTLTLEPGVLLMEIAKYVEPAGFFYPPDPGEKTATINAANGQKATAIANANSDLAEFWGLYAELNKDPEKPNDPELLELITSRIFTEKVSTAISKIGKIIVTEDGDNKIFLDP